MANIGEMFLKGKNYEEFLKDAEGKSYSKLKEVYDSINFPEGIENRIKSIHKKIKVLLFAESWCPDCIVSVPILVKMAKVNKNIEYTILPRKGYENFLNNYQYEGKPKIPTFVFYDENFNELGAFIEIPQKIKSIYEKGYQPDIITARREYREGKYSEVVADEFLRIMGAAI